MEKFTFVLTTNHTATAAATRRHYFARDMAVQSRGSALVDLKEQCAPLRESFGCTTNSKQIDQAVTTPDVAQVDSPHSWRTKTGHCLGTTAQSAARKTRGSSS